ncbi:MAG: hypothetical protein L0Y54_23470 [Sporichthyaceae bacterium]|nr:hypothetical protein [Sporichthyaceae bacterium]
MRSLPQPSHIPRVALAEVANRDWPSALGVEEVGGQHRPIGRRRRRAACGRSVAALLGVEFDDQVLEPAVEDLAQRDDEFQRDLRFGCSADTKR